MIEIFTTLFPEQIFLELSPEEIEEAWPAETEYSYNVARRNAFINRLCLDAFCNWLKLESGIEQQPQVWPSEAGLPGIWEVVNGTAIQLGKTRLVLIPSEVLDTDDFCVPAEWVDIPCWAADYYLAMQVNVDQRWVRVWGYTTHKKLKQAGEYDPVLRNYSLDGSLLIADLNVMWVARQFGGDKKLAVPPVAELSNAEAEKLLKQLSQPSFYSPRLQVVDFEFVAAPSSIGGVGVSYSPRLPMVKFSEWAALMENQNWQERLYQLRVELATEQQKIQKGVNLGV